MVSGSYYLESGWYQKSKVYKSTYLGRKR